MRIAVDGRCLQGNRRGMGVYLHNLLAAMPEGARGHEVAVLLDAGLGAPREPLPPFVRPVTLGGAGGLVAWEQWRVPAAAARYEVLHAPANGAPLRSRAPVVVTLHDAIFMRSWRDISEVPYPRQIVGHAYRRLVYPSAARRAAEVITVSEASRRAIQERIGVPGGRITVIWEAVPAAFVSAPAGDAGEVAARLGVEPVFLLAMGAYERRKNVPLLFRVLDGLRARRGNCPQLVLAGAENLRATRYVEEAGRLSLRDRVRFLPYVADGDLKALYRSARAFLWPSFEEGFGLPMLEAMSCGAPVVASDIACHREIGAGGARFAPPGDPAPWIEAVEALLAAGAAADALRRAGAGRVGAFSWERAAEATLDVYERAAR